ncbi:MAG TPA: cellulose binding domain-containing protein [Polyangia bacterium]|nr:cellulose binding domain-containing protein [Polyangia bacterium]
MLRTRHPLVFVGALAALSGWAACQGPDQFFRNSAVETGTGGTTLVGTGGFFATGGTIGAAGAPGGTGGAVASGSGGSKLTGTGGVPGTGGTTATGGTGGATATGGATGSTGGAGGRAVLPQVVQIDTYCEAASTKQLNLYVDVLNMMQTALPLSQVTFRYWFTMGAIADTPTMDIFYSMSVPTSAITFKYVAVTPAVTGANEYLEVGFTSSAPSLKLLTDSGQIQIGLHGSAYTDGFDPNSTADYSFQACAGGATANGPPFTAAPTITAYVNGTLAWGTEPQ